jgi:nucleoside-triphosphatase THEP1
MINLNETAFDYVEYTQRNIVISGKAGTGKTTLLKRIKNETHKQAVVVAPTGVAAINAGGVTIHSFFQLPFNTYVPERSYLSMSDNVLNRERLLSKHRLNKERIAVLKSLELLIIDEISMVRCDVMDMMDCILQHVRQEYHQPFGGVQVLMIGDMYQLAPVIKDDEWQEMKHYYNSAFFFDSGVYPSMNTIHIELNKIYRQQDEHFISILNGVRNNELTDDQYEDLHQCLDEYYEPRKNDGTIILTTHNQTADDINAERLASIKKEEQIYHAEREGQFDERNASAEKELHIKVGAQVMFVKNDVEKVRRFFNGKIGLVKALQDDLIIVEDDDGTEITVTKHVWENIRYEHNAKENRIDEEVIGRFKQFPLRLAWAITIHKSQGLTFDHVVIDAGRAFSPGQVYVALSRCRDLKGITLKSRIPKNHFKTDERIRLFYSQSVSNQYNAEHLAYEKIMYQFECVLHIFDLHASEKIGNAWMYAVMEHKKSINQDYQDLLFMYRERNKTLIDVSLRFQDELKRIHQNNLQPDHNEELITRTAKASIYFSSQAEDILRWLSTAILHTDNKQVKAKLNAIEQELFQFWHKKVSIWHTLKAGYNSSAYFLLLKTYLTPRLLKVDQAAPSGGSGEIHTLKQQLLVLRDELCEEHDLPAYRVATLQTIELLCAQLPQSEEQLLGIKGFGRARIRQFGVQFLQLIQDYCRLNHIAPAPPSEQNTKPTKRKKNNLSTHEISINLFKSGKSVDDIAKERSLTINTIEGHLAFGVSNHQLLAEDIIGAQKLNRIIQVIRASNIASLGELKKKLPEDVSFGEIRIALNHVQLNTSTY